MDLGEFLELIIGESANRSPGQSERHCRSRGGTAVTARVSILIGSPMQSAEDQHASEHREYRTTAAETRIEFEGIGISFNF